MYKLNFKEEEETEFKLMIWTMEKAREFLRNIYFCFIDYDLWIFDFVDHNMDNF